MACTLAGVPPGVTRDPTFAFLPPRSVVGVERRPRRSFRLRPDRQRRVRGGPRGYFTIFVPIVPLALGSPTPPAQGDPSSGLSRRSFLPNFEQARAHRSSGSGIKSPFSGLPPLPKRPLALAPLVPASGKPPAPDSSSPVSRPFWAAPLLQ